MTAVTVPADAGQAVDMVRAGLKYLAAVDATQLAVQVQAECLQGLEQATAIGTVARTSILEAFTAGQGYLDDGAYGLRSWLLHQVRISKGPAAGDAADEILVAAARGGMDLHDLAALAAEMLAGAATSPQGHIWGVSRPVGRGQSGPVS